MSTRTLTVASLAVLILTPLALTSATAQCGDRDRNDFWRGLVAGAILGGILSDGGNCDDRYRRPPPPRFYGGYGAPYGGGPYYRPVCGPPAPRPIQMYPPPPPGYMPMGNGLYRRVAPRCF